MMTFVLPLKRSLVSMTFVSVLASIAPAQSYTFQDLGVSNVDPGTVHHINNAGQALVRAQNVSYRVTGATVQAVPGFSQFAATFGAGLSEGGAVLGSSEIGTFQDRGLVYTSGSPQQLATLGKNSYATSMNAWGGIVGSSSRLVPGSSILTVTRAVVFAGAGGITELPSLGGTFGSSEANWVSDSGLIVGRTDVVRNGGLVGVAAKWANGAIETLPELDASHRSSTALKANGDGSVLTNNYGTASGAKTRAAILRNGVYTDLGDMGSGSAGAFTMNANGDVIGTSGYADGSFASFLWTSTSGFFDLNKYVVGNGSVYSQFQGFDINDSGLIVGVARLSGSGEYRAIVLTPQAVPEPGTTAVLGLGVAALLRRRRK